MKTERDAFHPASSAAPAESLPIELPTTASTTDADASAELKPVGGATPVVLAALSSARWSEHLRRLPGWRWDDTLGLVGPSAVALHVHSIESGKDGSVVVRWRAKASSCRDCPRRPARTTLVF